MTDEETIEAAQERQYRNALAEFNDAMGIRRDVRGILMDAEKELRDAEKEQTDVSKVLRKEEKTLQHWEKEHGVDTDNAEYRDLVHRAEDAKQDLEYADQRVQYADQRVQNAKQLLNDAERRLQNTRVAAQKVKAENEGNTMTLTINESRNAALAEYQTVGNLIHSANQSYFTEVWSKLNELCDQADKLQWESGMPFVAVEGSSGMGKTQFAFSLGSMGRPYFYWTATITDKTQPIYHNFQSISVAFEGLVRKDIRSYNRFKQKYEPGMNREALLSNFWVSGDGLWTFGFLHSILKKHLSTHQKNGMIYFSKIDFDITRCSLEKLKKCIEEFTGDRKVPIFILDEMVDFKKDAMYAAFCRDLFRVCPLLVVVMGTDSKIANVIDDGGRSRSFPKKWVCLITKFPTFVSHLVDQKQKTTWKELTKRFGCLSEIVKQSRGLFAKCFIEYCVNHWESEWILERNNVKSDKQAFCEVFNKALEHVGKTIRKWKRIMNTKDNDAVESHVSAVCYSNVDYSGDDRESEAKRRKLNDGRQEVKTVAMHNHFANFERSDIVDVYLNNSGYIVNERSWSPKCNFPLVKDDLLLYLAVIGCRNCPVFLDSLTNAEYSTRHILDMFENVPMSESVNEVSRSSSYLENILTIGVVTCSRRNGVEGILLDEFMEYLLGEFRDVTIDPKTRKLERSKLTFGTDKVSTSFFCKRLKEMKIPFLTPANGVWPDFIKTLDGCLFGELVRPPRHEICNLMIINQPWFIGEAKNWTKNLNSAELYEIIMKRWVKKSSWKFGLIVTNGIERSMLGTEKKEHKDVREYIEKNKINVVKVNCQSGEARYFLQDLWLKEDAERLLVILFNSESDSTAEGSYELTGEEQLERSSNIEEVVEAKVGAETTNALKEGDSTVDASARPKSKSKKRRR